MPFEFDDPDGDGVLRPTAERFASARKKPWFRPESTFGRMFLAASAVLALGVFVSGALMLRHYLQRDARFRIAGAENIQATGLTEVSRAQLLPVFGEDIGKNIFFVHVDERRKQLEEIPWIEHATVMRLLPDQIRVDIVERQPVAFTRHGQQIGLVDANGVLLAMAPATMTRHHYSFPVLTGIDPGDSPDARKARMAVYLQFMADLDADGKHNSDQISEIDLTDPEDARVLMPEQGADILTHFGDERFLERYQRYQAHIAEWRQQYPNLASVDLRYENQVVLDMASGKETAQTTDGQPGGAASAPPVASAKQKPSAKKPSAGTTRSGSVASGKLAAKKTGRAQNGKRTAVEKRAAAQSSTRRNTAATSRPPTGTPVADESPGG
ncbi:MAG: FtsQ-type POTRA domain-containing protein [Terracidiphilus sp.]|jgi:cell division protein FtsQ